MSDSVSEERSACGGLPRTDSEGSWCADSESSSVEFADVEELARDLGGLLDDEDFGDVRVRAAGAARGYTASSAVLRARSAYFRGALAAGWRRDAALAPNVRPEVFRDVAEYLHCGAVALDAGGKSLEVLVAADEMGLTHLVGVVARQVLDRATWAECVQCLEVGARLGPLPGVATDLLRGLMMKHGWRLRVDLGEASTAAVRLAMLAAGDNPGREGPRLSFLLLEGIGAWNMQQVVLGRTIARGEEEEWIDVRRGPGSSLKDYPWFRLLDDGRPELLHFLRFLEYGSLMDLGWRLVPPLRTARDYTVTPLWAADEGSSGNCRFRVKFQKVEWISTRDGRDQLPIIKSWLVYHPNRPQGVMVSFDHDTQVDGGNVWFSRDGECKKVWGSLADFSRRRCLKCFVIPDWLFYVHFELDADKLFPEVMTRLGLERMLETHNDDDHDDFAYLMRTRVKDRAYGPPG